MAASPVYLDGANGAGLFFIPTVGGDVVARKEDGTSQWSTSIGAPATGGIGCSSFATTPPLGILSTPVIDAQSKTIYVAGIVGTGSGVTDQIASAIDITTGKVKSGWPVKVDTASLVRPEDPQSAQRALPGERHPLRSVRGLRGRLRQYHGRVVSINTSTPTTVGQWATGDAGGGIWASGGLAADGNNIFVATGNYVPLSSAPATHTDSEEIVRITGMGTKADLLLSLRLEQLWTRTTATWVGNPMVITVPGATPSKLVLAIAKGGNRVPARRRAAARNTSGSAAGGQLASFALASGSGMNVYGAPAAYRTAMGTYVVMSSASAAGCPGGGTRQLMAVRITAQPAGEPRSSGAPRWQAPTNPIATTTDGTSDAIVWYANNGKLMGVDGDTGATIYTSSNTCSGVPEVELADRGQGADRRRRQRPSLCLGHPRGADQAPPPAKAKRHKHAIASASHTRG